MELIPSTFQAALKFIQTGDRIENAVGVKDQPGLSPHKRSSNTHMELLLVWWRRRRKRKWSHCRGRLTFLLLKYWGGGGRGGGGGTLKPLPPLKACFRKRIPMHTCTKAVTPLGSNGKANFHWTSIQFGFSHCPLSAGFYPIRSSDISWILWLTLSVTVLHLNRHAVTRM